MADLVGLGLPKSGGGKHVVLSPEAVGLQLPSMSLLDVPAGDYRKGLGTGIENIF